MLTLHTSSDKTGFNLLIFQELRLVMSHHSHKMQTSGNSKQYQCPTCQTKSATKALFWKCSWHSIDQYSYAQLNGPKAMSS